MSSEVEKGDGSCNNYEFCSVKDVALTHFAWLSVEGNAISRVLSEKPQVAATSGAFKTYTLDIVSLYR